MAIGAISGINAYTQAMQANNALQRKQINERVSQTAQATAGKATGATPQQSFLETINDSIKTVNDMQAEKKGAIESFASGETQNVHELMITMQKASVTMAMTSAVRNKVMESYKSIMQIQF